MLSSTCLLISIKFVLLLALHALTSPSVVNKGIIEELPSYHNESQYYIPNIFWSLNSVPYGTMRPVDYCPYQGYVNPSVANELEVQKMMGR